MNENIKELFDQIENKLDFINLLSNEFKTKPNSIRNNWFSSYYSIPEKHEPRVKRLIIKKLKLLE